MPWSPADKSELPPIFARREAQPKYLELMAPNWTAFSLSLQQGFEGQLSDSLENSCYLPAAGECLIAALLIVNGEQCVASVRQKVCPHPEL